VQPSTVPRVTEDTAPTCWQRSESAWNSANEECSHKRGQRSNVLHYSVIKTAGDAMPDLVQLNLST